MTTSADYIRGHYGVPARRGMRVLFLERPATITGFRDQYVLLRFDGDPGGPVQAHPTDITYPAAGETFNDPKWLVIATGGQLQARYTQPAQKAIELAAGPAARRVPLGGVGVAGWEDPAAHHTINVIAGLLIATLYQRRAASDALFGPVALTGWDGTITALNPAQAQCLAGAHAQVQAAVNVEGPGRWEQAAFRNARRLEQVR